MTVRLHTGDPCLYGAIREQMDHLDELGIAYDPARVSVPSRGDACTESGIYTSGGVRVLSSHVWKEEHRFREAKV